MVNYSQAVPPPEDNQAKKDRSWDDCLPDCGDCGSPSCDCDLPGCDIGLMMISWLALGRLFRLARPSTGPGGRVPRTRPTIPGRAGMAAIRGYQKWISPKLRTRCRHVPHCSAYGMEAVRRHGLRVGTQLAADRIRRCTAPTPHGTVDPVP